MILGGGGIGIALFLNKRAFVRGSIEYYSQEIVEIWDCKITGRINRSAGSVDTIAESLGAGYIFTDNNKTNLAISFDYHKVLGDSLGLEFIKRW